MAPPRRAALTITSPRASADIRAELGAMLRKLPKLRAELRVALEAERIKARAAVEAAYCRGDDLADICRDHRLTKGQLAGWAHRGRWARPGERVGALTPHQQHLYRGLRDGRTKAGAVALASEASP